MTCVFLQLFGIFDQNLDEQMGLANVFKMLTAPPRIDQAHLIQSEVGTLFLYYWGTGLFRLMFGSFVTAILVGTFNSTKGAIEKEVKDATMETHLNLIGLFDGENDEEDRRWFADLFWYGGTECSTECSMECSMCTTKRFADGLRTCLGTLRGGVWAHD